MKSTKKPSAADRTVDIFTGSTNVEAATQSDVVEQPKQVESGSETHDRWLLNAIQTQQFLSKKFADNEPESEKFRLTDVDGVCSFEKIGLDSKGQPFSWWLVQFRSDNLYEATSALVAAAKAKRERDGV